jgi:hypothetical protein
MDIMKNLYVAAAVVALGAALGASQVSAQGRGGGHGGGSASFMAAPGSERGLDRADIAAGRHGARGRANARTRGSHAMGFCPPGQAKKAGQGSRFAC